MLAPELGSDVIGGMWFSSRAQVRQRDGRVLGMVRDQEEGEVGDGRLVAVERVSPERSSSPAANANDSSQ